MKTKHTPKLIVLILSVMMIVSMFCVMTVSASAAETSETSEYTSPAANEAKIYSQGVNLGGDISMKYYVEIGTGVEINKLKLQTVFVGEANLLDAADETVVMDGKTLYVYTLTSVTPQCLGDDIDAQLIYNGTALTNDYASKNDYSVADNLVAIYDDSNEATKQLIIDTLEYGAAAQVYAGYKTGALVTADIDFLSNDTNDVEEIPASFPTGTKVDGETTLVEANVLFSYMNFLKFRFTGADASSTATVGGAEAKTWTEEPYFYAQATKGVEPFNFDEKYEVELGNINLSYSINDYCYAVSQKSNDDNMKALAKALYNYGLSAHIVKGNHKGGEATCTDGKYCDICGVEYDTAVDSTNHNWANGVCTYGCGTEHDHTSWSDSGVCNDCGKTATLAVGTVSGEDFTTKQYYTNLQTAVDNANGKTVKLLANVDLSTTLQIAKDTSVTIDLNGNTIKNAESFTTINDAYESEVKGLIYVKGSITITDSSEDESGAIIGDIYSVCSIDYTGTLTIHKGTYSSNRDPLISITHLVGDSPEIIITGGKFKGEGVLNVHVNCVSISGGTFDNVKLFDYDGPASTMTNLTGGTFKTLKFDQTSFSIGIATDHYCYDTEGNILTLPIYTSGEFTNVTIKKGADLSKSATVTLDTTSVSYNGSEQKPTITAVTVGGKTLAADKYTVSYTRDGATTTDFTSAGVITVTVTGTGDYSGSAKATYTISAADIADATADDISTQYSDNGNEIKPKPTLTFGGVTLTEGTDYTLTYSNNKVAGTATITVTGKGNFEGTKELTFTIVDHVHSWTYEAAGNVITATCVGDGDCPNKTATATVTATDGTYTGSAITTATVEYDGWIEAGLVELDIIYEDNENVGTATATISVDRATASVAFEIKKDPKTDEIDGEWVTIEQEPYVW